jgi:uncharacterized protein (DUF1697 family)
MKQIALLRAVNVAGKNKIIMDELCKSLEDLEFTNISSYIQSGNIIFESANDNKTNRTLIKDQIKKTFDLDIEVSVLYRKKLECVIKNSAFLDSDYDLKALYYCFLFDKSEINNIDDITAKATQDEEIILNEDMAYLYYPNGMGKSKITNNLIESKLKVSSTIRSHNTIVKLLELSK